MRRLLGLRRVHGDRAGVYHLRLLRLLRARREAERPARDPRLSEDLHLRGSRLRADAERVEDARPEGGAHRDLLRVVLLEVYAEANLAHHVAEDDLLEAVGVHVRRVDFLDREVGRDRDDSADVVEAGGAVKVVFMTSGDGFPAGVVLARHIQHPQARDYREYGMLRQKEAKRALATLGMHSKDVLFLGFPDSGLCPLQTQ